MTLRETDVPIASGRRSLPELIAETGEAFTDPEDADLAPLIERIGASRIVLIGEASHGTAEFYAIRARLTRELIERGHGLIRFVALEADWPDAARLDAWVRQGEPGPGPDRQGPAFSRFPTWMWRNEPVLAFVDWLRDWNAQREPAERVAIHGLDLYSLGESIDRVIAFLEQVDPDLASTARQRYGCLSPFVTDPAMYGYAAWSSRHGQCEDEVVGVLRELLDQRLELAHDGHDAGAVLDAVSNARVVAGAERYYRTMYQGGAASWNLRDEHMFDTLVRVLDAHGQDARGVVWAHNSHLGDASATEMAERGELNVGQLSRQHFGDAAYLVGFGTHSGTVAAARDWGGEVEVMRVRPSLDESYERVFHDSLHPGALVPLRDPASEEIREGLLQPRLERAIGVIYRPDTERQSHYFGARLADQFDEYVWLDLTRAVAPLGPASAPRAPGHAFAALDR